MNHIYLVYRYDEYGDKHYLQLPNGLPFATFQSHEINDYVEKYGGGWNNGWIIEIFYNTGLTIENNTLIKKGK